jgi:metal-dependent amidase/aminoacylase/carboxypeptidase family protein
MASELENNIRAAAAKLAKALADATDLTVETNYVEIDPKDPNNLDKTFIVARTIIQLDGDQQTIIPMQRGDSGGLVLDDTLMAVHQQNVKSAIDYRSKSIETLLTMLPGRGR